MRRMAAPPQPPAPVSPPRPPPPPPPPPRLLLRLPPLPLLWRWHLSLLPGLALNFWAKRVFHLSILRFCLAKNLLCLSLGWGQNDVNTHKNAFCLTSCPSCAIIGITPTGLLHVGTVLWRQYIHFLPFGISSVVKGRP